MAENKGAKKGPKTTKSNNKKRPKSRGGNKVMRIRIPMGPRFFANFITSILLFVILITLFSSLNAENKDIKEIPISTLATEVVAGEVDKLTVSGETVEILLLDGTYQVTKKEVGTAITDTLVNYGVDLSSIENLDIEIKRESGFFYWLINLAPFLIPLLFIGFFIWLVTRQSKGGQGGMQAFTFGQSRARIIDPNDKNTKITFKDVAGAKEAKQELLEIVDFLRNPKKFLDIGAEIPKGVILMGAPGTGKTLLARAVAGEAKVPFFSISGSEFVEMFVGVGASRVRDLFKIAKRAAPSIIFVDEIDAVGRVRGTGVGGGNDEREQTLNQILVEMDGFEPNHKVIVMAATNRPDVLDPALLRPGRFDRRVTIDLPDLDDREAILGIHVRKKPLAEDVKLRVIAERTPGFSGADLYSLVNEAAIWAARDDRKTVGQFDFINAIEKVLLGPERSSHLLSKKEKRVTAYHEAGHALVASILPNTDPVHKISIISRGRAAGYTLHLPVIERRFKSKKEFIDDIAVTLAGYVVEKLVFGDLTTGPSNDLQVVTAKARAMVTKYGMSDEIGPVALEGDGGLAVSGHAPYSKEHSEKVAGDIDREVSRIVEEGRATALRVVEENRKLLDTIAHALIEKETLEREEYEQILIANDIPIKKDRDSEIENQ